MTVKLTKEQENQIKILRNSKENSVKAHIDGWKMRESLNTLTLNEFIKCLYMQDYEVEPEFEVGDYVFSKTWGRAGKVVTTNDTFITTVSFKDHVRNMRHVTESEIKQEKERRFWSSHGRDVGQYELGDILHRNIPWEVTNVLLSGMCTLRSKDAVITRDKKYLSKMFWVSAFAHERLDVSHGD